MGDSFWHWVLSYCWRKVAPSYTKSALALTFLLRMFVFWCMFHLNLLTFRSSLIIGSLLLFVYYAVSGCTTVRKFRRFFPWQQSEKIAAKPYVPKDPSTPLLFSLSLSLISALPDVGCALWLSCSHSLSLVRPRKYWEAACLALWKPIAGYIYIYSFLPFFSFPFNR